MNPSKHAIAVLQVLALLLAAMAPSCAAAANPPPASASAPAYDVRDSKAKDAQAQKALTIVVPKVDFTNLELKDVVEFLRTAGDVNIHVNWAALVAGGVDKTTAVTLQLSGASLGKILELVLADLSTNTKITYVIDDGVVVISTKDDLAKTPRIRLYYVGDIVSALRYLCFPKEPADNREPDYSGCMDMRNSDMATTLADTVKWSIDKDSWTPTGTVGSLQVIGDDMVVTQTIENHEAVKKLLDEIRRSIDSKRVALGQAVVRLGAGQDLKALRQALKDSRDVASALAAGADRNAWTLEACRVEQTLLRKRGGFERLSGRNSLGYEVSIVPQARRPDGLAVGVTYAAKWLAAADRDEDFVSGRDSMQIVIPSGGWQMVELIPAGAPGGAAVLVVWQSAEQKK